MGKIKLFILLLAVVTSGYSQGNGTSFKGIDRCYNKTFSVSVHIIEDSTGNQGVSMAQINAALVIANTHFAKICVSFNVCSTYVHPNVRNDSINRGIEDKEIAVLYDVPNTINVYYSTYVKGGGHCGFTTLGTMTVPPITPDRDAIFLMKSCATGIGLTHELGNYFGLYHTFEQNANGIEFVDGSNCATTGDLICDTPADPPYGSSLLNSNCDLNVAQTDPNGNYYNPDVCNIMSYYTTGCGDYHFTTGQYNRMVGVMETGRNYLW